MSKGKGMTLRDILQGASIDVQERFGSQFVQTNDVLFGRAVSVDGVGMFIGLAQTIIPPGQKPEFRLARNRQSFNCESICSEITTL